MNIEKITFIVVTLLVVAMAVTAFIKFLDLPTSQKIEKVKQLALDWVKIAEDKYGGSTGPFKLAHAYSLFVGLYPSLSKWISLSQFDKLIQEALSILRASLSK